MKCPARVIAALLQVAVAVSIFVEPVLPAEPSSQNGAIRVLEDSFDWSITRPQVTWRLDQKVLDQLRLSSEEVNQHERALRDSIIEAVGAEAAVKASLQYSAQGQSAVSLNPLQMLLGNGAQMGTATDLLFSGKLGGSVAKSASRDITDINLESTRKNVDISFVRAISEPRLQFTVTIRNRLPDELTCKNIVIPIWGYQNVLAEAVPVDEEGRTIQELTIPANRPDGVDQLFVAKIADTEFWDFVQNGGLAKGLDLRLERGTGQIRSGANGADLISARSQSLRNCVSVKVEIAGGAEMTWWVERGAAGRTTVIDVLAAINDLLRQRLDTRKECFCFEGGALVSAFGCDQYLSGWVWDVRVDGNAVAIGEDLRESQNPGFNLSAPQVERQRGTRCAAAEADGVVETSFDDAKASNGTDARKGRRTDGHGAGVGTMGWVCELRLGVDV
jgi:hypothetical protein